MIETECVTCLLADDGLEADAGRPRADPHHDVGVVDGATRLVHGAEHHRLVAQLLADLQQRFTNLFARDCEEYCPELP